MTTTTTTTRLGSRLERDFFERPTLKVAPELIGKLLVIRNSYEAKIVVRLTEVEAYLGEKDPASHASRGPTPRAKIMFGPAGRMYVYLSYGINYCCNVICEEDGIAGAVLFRSGEVLSGESLVRQRREGLNATSPVSTVYNSGLNIKKEIPFHKLLAGPGNFCKGLGINISDNNLDLTSPTSLIKLYNPEFPTSLENVLTSPRIGISRNQQAPYRFTLKNSPCISRP